MPIMTYIRLGVLVCAVLASVIVTHMADNGRYEALVAKHEIAQRQALEWGMNKQKEYDNAAITAAEKYAQAEAERADAAQKRLAVVPPPRVLVRGCLTYEFVRALDAAITHREVRALPLPTGKSNDTCAPVDATTVVRWVLGIIDAAEQRGDQLTALQQFIREAQRLR